MSSITAAGKRATQITGRVSFQVHARRTAGRTGSGRWMSTQQQAPTSFSHEKMEVDARYKTTVDIPKSLMQTPKEESPFSIQGKFREGRAAYLDMSATTPLDPRVLDAMAPYMVSISMVLDCGTISTLDA